MACCLFCFPDDPIEGDIRNGFRYTWKVNMLNAPMADCGCCCISCLCPCCAQMVMRNKALKGDMSKYVCCQGYYDGLMCVKSGSCGESSAPMLCLCLESFCCNSCALSSTRFLIMDRMNIQPDPMDNRIIRFNNCIQMLSCICDILSICISELKECAAFMRLCADCVYLTTSGCMTAQMNVQLQAEEELSRPPKAEDMERV